MLRKRWQSKQQSKESRWGRYDVGIDVADCLVEMSETPQGLQKYKGKALEYTRIWRVTANVKSAQ